MGFGWTICVLHVALAEVSGRWSVAGWSRGSRMTSFPCLLLWWVQLEGWALLGLPFHVAPLARQLDFFPGRLGLREQKFTEMPSGSGQPPGPGAREGTGPRHPSVLLVNSVPQPVGIQRRGCRFPPSAEGVPKNLWPFKIFYVSMCVLFFFFLACWENESY